MKQNEEQIMDDIIDNEDIKINDLLYYYLFSILVFNPEKEWKDFCNDLTYKYRFSSESNIVKELHERASEVVYTLKKESLLYRARIYNKNPYDNIFPNTNEAELEFAKSELISYLLSPDTVSPIANKEKHIYEKWKKQLFKGYNADESGAPPQSSVCSGRVNPEFIRYLYLCEDETTPIYEVRPIINQFVSVAKFEVKRDLKIYDLTKNFIKKDDIYNLDIPTLFDFIGLHFSEPCNGTPIEYLPTQFLSEEIRKMGFDGLRFESSIKKDGMNVVIFDPNECTAVSSDIFQVKNINLDIAYADIYDVNNQLKYCNN